MQITPEWVAAIAGALGAAGVFGAWIQRQITARRNATPIVRCVWRQGPAGYSAKIEIVNRINEDLQITRAVAPGLFVEDDLLTDNGGSIVGSNRRYIESPRLMSVSVPAGGSAKLAFGVESSAKRRWIRLSISSSHKTLRNKRLTLRYNSSE